MAIIRHQMMFLLVRERLNFGYRQSAMKRMSHLDALMVHRDNGVLSRLQRFEKMYLPTS